MHGRLAERGGHRQVPAAIHFPPAIDDAGLNVVLHLSKFMLSKIFFRMNLHLMPPEFVKC